MQKYYASIRREWHIKFLDQEWHIKYPEQKRRIKLKQYVPAAHTVNINFSDPD